MAKRDFISVADLSSERLLQVIRSASSLKSDVSPQILKGRTVALIFQKPSLRTKVSFDVAVSQLGGHPIYLAPEEVGLGQREPIPDVARVLSRYVDLIVARVFGHEVVEALAKWASVPVVNALSDGEHPCQTLADLQTIKEHKGQLEGLTVAYVGDGNNVAASLALGAALTGMHLRVASPPGYEVPQQPWRRAQALAKEREVILERGTDPGKAVQGADVVYTDVWTSMGQETEANRRRADFAAFQVTPALLTQARPGSLFMHPLPAHHGEEIAPGLLEHSSSVVFDQAENRLHAQKALLIELVGQSAN